jgi:predicted PurR-regulated permease PerM
MWGFLIGLYIAVLIYPFIEEWQQRRIDRSRLAKMRAHHATGHRWDVAKGQWSDE